MALSFLEVSNPDMTHPAFGTRSAPLVGETQAKRMVRLGETQTVANNRLSHRTSNIIGAGLTVREGFPHLILTRLHDADDGLRAGLFAGDHNLVIGVVREERLIGILTSASQSSRRGDIHPQVVVRSQRDKERLHSIAVSYLIVGVVTISDERTGGSGGGQGNDRRQQGTKGN